MAQGHFIWMKGAQDALASQLVTIGDQLSGLDPKFGVTSDDVAYWQYGAAVNNWLQVMASPSAHNLATGLTTSRDELQLDKTVEDWVAPTYALPAMPALPAGVAPLQTDFLDWCNRLYVRMQTNGLTPAQAKLAGFDVPETPATPPGELQPRIVSNDTQPAGKTIVTTTRDGQTMVHCQLTLDSGEVLDKTLATTKFTFMLPTDRVHAFTSRAIYADKNGEDIGQWSEAKPDTSEV